MTWSWVSYSSWAGENTYGSSRFVQWRYARVTKLFFTVVEFISSLQTGFNPKNTSVFVGSDARFVVKVCTLCFLTCAVVCDAHNQRSVAKNDRFLKSWNYHFVAALFSFTSRTVCHHSKLYSPTSPSFGLYVWSGAIFNLLIIGHSASVTFLNRCRRPTLSYFAETQILSRNAARLSFMKPSVVYVWSASCFGLSFPQTKEKYWHIFTAKFRIHLLPISRRQDEPRASFRLSIFAAHRYQPTWPMTLIRPWCKIDDAPDIKQSRTRNWASGTALMNFEPDKNAATAPRVIRDVFF